jgi:hypothetical protein
MNGNTWHNGGDGASHLRTKSSLFTPTRRERGGACSRLACALLLCCAPLAQATEGAFSNYIPGTYGDFAAALAPATEFTVRNDLYHYEGDAGQSVRGGVITTELETELLINLTTLIYKPDVELFGAQYALGMMVPVVKADIETNIQGIVASGGVKEDDSGLADVAFIPGALFWSWDKLHVSLTEIIVAPTGNYDKDALVNTGLNHWSFDTTAAVTYLNPENGRELSAILGYIYNTENSDTDYKSGQEMHLDFMFNQYLSESFAVGIHGFYLKQITGDSGDGALLGDFKGEAAGIGPALLWNIKRENSNVSVIAKWLHEHNTENRLKGDYVSLSVAIGF